MKGPREPWECHQQRHLTYILPPQRAHRKRAEPGSQGCVRRPCSARESPAPACLTLPSLAAFYTHLPRFHLMPCWTNCFTNSPSSLSQPGKLGMKIPIIQRGTLRHREVKQVVQGVTGECSLPDCKTGAAP